jgi:hypothetical protein
MDWGYLELPTDEENVARFTPEVWAKTAVERHSKKDNKRIRVGIDSHFNAGSFASGCKKNPSKTQKMAFINDFGLIFLFLNNSLIRV